ncbi:hypothetical protein F5144DRAFT_215506 [Chaetomium tenue]|uniref:Uncharacterized protein n=1 Tax=Chaetomium tenue TaxID=1854479 RepID=A0ACB7P7B5_9PEZI|nr:hypothetical protein F5144DRAFT_215506 [Chaetomium globosum]
MSHEMLPVSLSTFIQNISTPTAGSVMCQQLYPRVRYSCLHEVEQLPYIIRCRGGTEGRLECDRPRDNYSLGIASRRARCPDCEEVEPSWAAHVHGPMPPSIDRATSWRGLARGRRRPWNMPRESRHDLASPGRPVSPKICPLPGRHPPLPDKDWKYRTWLLQCNCQTTPQVHGIEPGLKTVRNSEPLFANQINEQLSLLPDVSLLLHYSP